MIKIIAKASHSQACTDSLTLAFDLRQKARLQATLDSGAEAGLFLPRGDILRQLATSEADVCVLGFEPKDAAAYGRIIMEVDAPARIVEFKDADAPTSALGLCNGGAMGVRASVLNELLPQLQNDNAQGEYYLPDLVH